MSTSGPEAPVPVVSQQAARIALRARQWAMVMIPLAVYGIAAPYISRAVSEPIPVPTRVEVVDHALPGVVLLAVAALTLILRRLSLAGTLIATLAGFWMTATHVPLLAQAQRGEVAWMPALIHSLGGIAILLLALTGAVKAWVDTPD